MRNHSFLKVEHSRKFIIIITLFCVLAVLGVIMWESDNDQSVPYVKCVVEGDSFQELMNDRTQVYDASFSVLFDGEELTQDKANDVFFFSIIGDGVGSFNPRVLLTTSDNSAYDIAFEKRFTKDTVKANETIRFMVYNEDCYQVYGLKCTTLPIISIDTETEISDYPEDITDISFKVFDNREGVVKRIYTSDGSLHARGATSISRPKKSFRISLNEKSGDEVKKNKMSLLGMRRDEDWILNALSVDPAKVRDVFSTNLWNDTVAGDNSYGLNLGIEYKYVELFINDEYHGLYALGYPVQGAQFNISQEDDDTILFKKDVHVREGVVFLDNSGNMPAYRLQSKHSSKYNSAMIKYLTDLDESVNNPDRLKSLIDLDNAIDLYLYVTMIQGEDNIYKNQNVILKRNGDKYKMLYIPWDMDLSWGFVPGAISYEDEVDVVFKYDYEALYYLLQCDTDNTRELIRNKYKKLRKDSWSDGELSKAIDEYEQMVFGSGAYLRDMARWPESDYIEPQNGLNSFKQYVIDRMKYMDSYVDNLYSDPDFNYEGISFASEEVSECANQLFTEENEMILLEINNKKLWSDDAYRELLLRAGVPEEYINMDKTLSGILEYNNAQYNPGNELDLNDTVDMLWGNNALQVIAIPNFFSKNSYVESSSGTLAYYVGDDGTGGLYLNGNEIYVDSISERQFDMRLIHIDADTYEVKSINEYKIFSE